MILLALNIYHGQDMIRHTTLAASENMVDKSEHLSNYMQRYMEPYYKAVIDGSIWTEIEDVTRDVKSNSNRIFSLLEGYSTPTNNEVALMFLMRKDESGYLTIRLPAGQQIIVTKNNKMFYEDLIRLGNEGMDNQELVTAKLEYHSKMCLGLSQTIYHYKTKECYGSLVMLMSPETRPISFKPRAAAFLRIMKTWNLSIICKLIKHTKTKCTGRTGILPMPWIRIKSEKISEGQHLRLFRLYRYYFF